MLVMRPSQLSDLAEVQRLAAISPVGVTSLPDSADRLREKILASEASFAAEVAFNGEETYFFVLEDTARGGLVGCSGLVASAGYTEPFYSFRNKTFEHVSRELNIHNKTHALSLRHDLTGNSLLDSFFVEADKAPPPADELISRGRLLFVADHPERFADSVAVDILGISDAQGDSPFWDGVGRHFFGMSYAEAAHLSGVKSRSFLAELMPHYPIYVPLLSDEAQEAMGEVNPDAQASFDILTREGFETEHYIDIFDGGPTLHARTSAIRSIVHSQQLEVQLSDAPLAQGGRTWLVANGLLQDFRALLVELDWEPGMSLYLDRTTAEALGVGEGASVRLVAL